MTEVDQLQLTTEAVHRHPAEVIVAAALVVRQGHRVAVAVEMPVVAKKLFSPNSLMSYKFGNIFELE